MRIKSLSVENFTLFGKHQLKFSEGLNIIVGENETGKSHLLRLLYSLIESNNLVAQQKTGKKNYLLQKLIPQKLIDIFKPEELAHLIKLGQNKSHIKIDLTEYSIQFNFTQKTKKQVNIDQAPTNFLKQDSLFIPTKEILSFYDGFISLYLTRQLPVDEIYFNLAKALGLLVLKEISLSSPEQKILTHLETLLNGKLLLEKGRVYLSKKGKKLEISLVAEGLRKIGTLSHLIANGSLTKNTIRGSSFSPKNLNLEFYFGMNQNLT
jgi:predicted ATP-dependent endonuclease of OLD family